MATDNVVSLREFQEALDRSYLIRTWLMSSAPKDQMPGYFRSQALLIEDKIKGKTVLVACLTETPDVIVGFAVLDAERDTVHYVTVRRNWVGTGVLQALLQAAGERMTT